MLVPLTQSVYVAGELADTDRILLDIGTGYFVQACIETLSALLSACPSRPSNIGLQRVPGMSLAALSVSFEYSAI